jgi:hypothetical protein
VHEQYNFFDTNQISPSHPDMETYGADFLITIIIIIRLYNCIIGTRRKEPIQKNN